MCRKDKVRAYVIQQLRRGDKTVAYHSRPTAVFGWDPELHVALQEVKAEGIKGVTVNVEYSFEVYDWVFTLRDETAFLKAYGREEHEAARRAEEADNVLNQAVVDYMGDTGRTKEELSVKDLLEWSTDRKNKTAALCLQAEKAEEERIREEFI